MKLPAGAADRMFLAVFAWLVSELLSQLEETENELSITRAALDAHNVVEVSA